jgi:hypothetical protein
MILLGNVGLFQGKSIDTLMLCCLLASLTFSGETLSFSRILKEYRKQPQLSAYNGQIDEDFYDTEFRPFMNGDIRQQLTAMNVCVYPINLDPG